MERRLAPLTLAVLVVAPSAAGAAEEAAALASRITKVTVFSDRAQVTRSASLTPGTTPSVHAFRRLPGWVDDGSVRVEITPADAGRILDVRVTRDYLARATDPELRQAEAAVEEVTAGIAALDDEMQVLEAQAKQIEAIKAFSVERFSRDTAIRDVSVAGYRHVLDFISSTLRETARARRDVARRRAELAPVLAARQRRLEELRSLTQLEETTVWVTVIGPGAGPATVELTYMLPGATWEPSHELRTRGGAGDQAEVVSFATVTQTSGEDWDDVDIAFATQSSRESIRIPELQALTLGEAPRPTRMVRTEVSSFHRAQAAFEGQSRAWNRLAQKASASVLVDEVYDNNFRMFQVVQSRTVQLFQQLQKRGTTAHFAGLGRQTVRGDGRPTRVVIGRCALAATPRIVAAPEESLNAAQTLQMVNTGSQPLLPGKVSLYRDGGFLGMTDVDFVAEGEPFALFLGVADQIKLARVLDRKASSLVRRSRNRMNVAFLVTVENLGTTEATVHLADRVPVSEDRDIRVDQVEVDGGASPDADGLVHWTLTLAPRQKRTLRVAYRIEYPPTLVLATAPSPGQGAQPSSADIDLEAAPANSPERLRRQIKDLEQVF